MPKSRKRKGLEQSDKRKPHAFWSKGKILVGSFVGLVGLASGTLSMLPRVAVTPPSQPIDHYHPLSIFTVTNTGPIPLWDTEMFLGDSYISTMDEECSPQKRFDNDKELAAHKSSSFNRWATWEAKRLETEQTFQIRLEDLIKPYDSTVKFACANIAIVVKYNPWFLPLRSLGFSPQSEFRFKTRDEEDGKFTWIPVPIEY